MFLKCWGYFRNYIFLRKFSNIIQIKYARNQLIYNLDGIILEYIETKIHFDQLSQR